MLLWMDYIKPCCVIQADDHSDDVSSVLLNCTVASESEALNLEGTSATSPGAVVSENEVFNADRMMSFPFNAAGGL